MHLPAPVHRAALRLAHTLRKYWWHWARPRVSGCRVVALDGEGRVLLIRHSYGSGLWMLPGGGLKRGEDALATARRELAEETGCALAGATEIAVLEENLQGARNRVHLVAGRAEGPARADGREIVEAAFFAPDALPAAMPAAFHRDLPGWIAAARDSL